MKIELTVPWTLQGVRVACAALTTINVLLLKDAPRVSGGRSFPPLYQSGVVYRRQQGPERFLPLPIVYARGHGDCDQLAAWRCAELQCAGINAKAVPYFSAPKLMHVIVLLPDGTTEDPSKLLGMRGRA